MRCQIATATTCRKPDANCTRGRKLACCQTFRSVPTLTDDELHIVRALKKKHATNHPTGNWSRWPCAASGKACEAPHAYLERPGLAHRLRRGDTACRICSERCATTVSAALYGVAIARLAR